MTAPQVSPGHVEGASSRRTLDNISFDEAIERSKTSHYNLTDAQKFQQSWLFSEYL